jgi:hypothetical protein
MEGGRMRIIRALESSKRMERIQDSLGAISKAIV